MPDDIGIAEGSWAEVFAEFVENVVLAAADVVERWALVCLETGFDDSTVHDLCFDDVFRAAQKYYTVESGEAGINQRAFSRGREATRDNVRTQAVAEDIDAMVREERMRDEFV